MKKKMESKRYDLDIVSNLEQFKFTDALTDNCWGSNHVFQFCLEPVGDTSTRRPGKRWQIRPICLPSNRNRGNFDASKNLLSLFLDSFQRDNFFHPSPFSYKGRASGVSIGGAEPISVQITDLQIRIAVCEITNRFAATISNILRDGGEIGGEKRSHVRSRDRLCYFYL